jgi:hypothetical protein
VLLPYTSKLAPQLAWGDLNSFNVVSNSSEAGFKLPSRPKRHASDGAITLFAESADISVHADFASCIISDFVGDG